jgi:predicted MPP superfamily phosphohydrolase
MLVLATVIVCLALACLVYGWFEAGWLRTRVLDVEIEGLAAGLDGLRIAHLSDFHLGAPLSRGNRASVSAAAWVVERSPDVVCITGDLVSHPRGESRLQAMIRTLDRPLVVLGNHDVAVTRDPFSRAAELRDLEDARLLVDERVALEPNSERLLVAGVDPVSYRDGRARPDLLVDDDVSFRLLLCHFPGIVDRMPPNSFDLILAGHLHAGQICIPTPRGRITLAHPRARFVSGLYSTSAGLMHVSPGTGTTFVPFRFFARPEVTELVLRRPH